MEGSSEAGSGGAVGALNKGGGAVRRSLGVMQELLGASIKLEGKVEKKNVLGRKKNVAVTLYCHWGDSRLHSQVENNSILIPSIHPSTVHLDKK